MRRGRVRRQAVNFETESERYDALVRHLLDELGEKELDRGKPPW